MSFRLGVLCVVAVYVAVRGGLKSRTLHYHGASRLPTKPPVVRGS